VEQTKKYLREVVSLPFSLLFLLSLFSPQVRNGYWNTNQSYFVESSTRLALRLPLLRQAADMFGDQKYIISIKVALSSSPPPPELHFSAPNLCGWGIRKRRVAPGRIEKYVSSIPLPSFDLLSPSPASLHRSWSAYQDMLILLDVDGMKTSHQHQGKTL
jgi:hypothetical protein